MTKLSRMIQQWRFRLVYGEFVEGEVRMRMAAMEW